MQKKQITQEDIAFYIEMVKPPYGHTKGYYRFLKDFDSAEYKTFLYTYSYFREKLSEREKIILDLVYSHNKEVLTLKNIGARFGISGSRVSAIRNLAERRLTTNMINYTHGNNPKKTSFYSIIRDSPDEELIKLLHVARPWESVIKHFAEVGKLSSARRKRVIHILWRVWDLNMLDHRKKLIELININDNEINWD
jgi:hypothetical protein